MIAKSRKAGNFVIVRIDSKGERMPLTIADSDIKRGTITLVVQEVGLSSIKLCRLNEGDNVADVVGPLGTPTHIEKFGTVICAGGGVGVAPMLPIIRALKAAGNRVLSVIAGRNKDLIILENEVRASSDRLIIMTDDGSYGEKGMVTAGMEKLIQQEGHVDKAFAIGPPIMMKFCCTEIWYTDRRVAQHHHGRRHRHVRSLPTDYRRQDQVCVYRWSGIRRFAGRLGRDVQTHGNIQTRRTRGTGTF